MRKYLAYYETEWPANIAELTAIENKPFVGYLESEGVKFTVIPEPVTGPANNEIWYTSSNGNVVTPNKTDVFGANIVSNTYENDKGVITFDGPATSIGKMAFSSCSNLTSITIPDSVTSIGSRAFENCSSLTSITIPNSMTDIGSEAFNYCSSLTSIVIPDSVTSIGHDAFDRCRSLTSVTIGNSVTRIGSGDFSWCPAITYMVVREGNMVYDSRENCNAIIETATSTLIRGCQNTIIPDSVTSIGSGAFSDCSSLASITIPNSVTSIRDSAFSNCTSLTSITCEAATPPTIGYYNRYSNITAVYVPAESVEAYKTES